MERCGRCRRLLLLVPLVLGLSWAPARAGRSPAPGAWRPAGAEDPPDGECLGRASESRGLWGPKVQGGGQDPWVPCASEGRLFTEVTGRAAEAEGGVSAPRAMRGLVLGSWESKAARPVGSSLWVRGDARGWVRGACMSSGLSICILGLRGASV